MPPDRKAPGFAPFPPALPLNCAYRASSAIVSFPFFNLPPRRQNVRVRPRSVRVHRRAHLPLPRRLIAVRPQSRGGIRFELGLQRFFIPELYLQLHAQIGLFRFGPLPVQVLNCRIALSVCTGAPGAKRSGRACPSVPAATEWVSSAMRVPRPSTMQILGPDSIVTSRTGARSIRGDAARNLIAPKEIKGIMAMKLHESQWGENE